TTRSSGGAPKRSYQTALTTDLAQNSPGALAAPPGGPTRIPRAAHGARRPSVFPRCLRRPDRPHAGIHGSRAPRGAYSHSIVPGGLLVMSKTTRLIWRTSL